MKTRAKNLRKNFTDAEDHLWQFLRNRSLNGYKFRRQHVIDPYIVDFLCIKKKLIVELDGGQHQENIEYDDNRTLFLRKREYIILRFWNHQILQETDAVLEKILLVLEKLT